MASSSVSSLHKRFKYDVFLSFRGEDVRKTFVDHLYASLDRQGILTFKDDKRLEKGARFDKDLINSIRDSKCFIIVFSQNYASSSWCLNELVEIMECQKNKEQKAYPVFYHVDPSEVRKQEKSYGEALAKHNNDKKDIGKWREALLQAGGVSGYDVKTICDGHEAEVIKQIVAEISDWLRTTYYLSNDENLVGMETRIPHVLSCLDIGSNDVRMIGIKGMGGAGKTTLARAIFERISFHFEGVSFVDNVRENSKASVSGLQSLQQKILCDVLKEQHTISSSVDGKRMMENRLSGIKALVVLDDVDDLSQLEALAGVPKWFKPGSRIIITTRDERVLVAHGVAINYVNLLSDEEAICLFNRYAFKGDTPVEGYEEHSQKVVRYAAGLPLTIKVLGSLLCGQVEPVWIDVLKRLETIPLQETQEILELSYNSLDNEHKEIFLDVACLLKGWPKKDAFIMLESCGYYVTYGLAVLEQKSLVTYSRFARGDYLDMHDHIQEMGMNIVRRDHPNEPNKHSRLWNEEEIEDVLGKGMEKEATRCIAYKLLRPKVTMKGLQKMKNLRVLHVVADRDPYYLFEHPKVITKGLLRSLKFDASPYFPNALQYLFWVGYPFCSLPKRFQANNLVSLIMRHSKIEQLWKEGEKKVLNNLRFLDLTGSNLTKFDIRLTPNLEELNLQFCGRLSELDLSIGCPKLTLLLLSYSNLKKLDIGPSPNLNKLELFSNDYLVDINMTVENCPNLRSLEFIDFQESWNFNTWLIPNLEKLRLSRAVGNFDRHIIRIASRKLKYLEISLFPLRTLDLRLCSGITHCEIIYCKNLEELLMPAGCPDLMHCEIFGSKLKTLDLGLTPHLSVLKLKNCEYLEELHMRVGCLKELAHLELVGCTGLKSFVLTKEQESHPSVESLHILPLDSNHSMPKISISSTGNLEKVIHTCCCSSLKNIIKTADWLPNLKEVILGCSIPQVFKLDNEELEYIEEVKFSCPVTRLLSFAPLFYRYVNSIKLEHCTSLEELPMLSLWLKDLKSLHLVCCSSLEKLPEDLGNLKRLEDLIVQECKRLRDIPHSICEMKSLKRFHLTFCVAVEKLPEKIGDVKSLTELNIVGAGIRHLPQSIYSLKDLRIIRNCDTNQFQHVYQRRMKTKARERDTNQLRHVFQRRKKAKVGAEL